MQLMIRLFFIATLALTSLPTVAQTKKPKFRIVAMSEAGGIHKPFVDAARIWLDKLAADSGFVVDYIENTEKINDRFLSKYPLFIQLNYPPYMWSDTAKQAFEKYIRDGKGGWIGFHHATLLGEFDGYAMWPWFSQFMGDIRFTNYIAGFARATVRVEDKSHPCMKDLPDSFVVEKDEWYTYNKSPRPNTRVLASVDESTYYPSTEIMMGDHPVIWSNEKMKARNVYIFMGHHPSLFDNEAFTSIFRNSIFWAAKK